MVHRPRPGNPGIACDLLRSCPVRRPDPEGFWRSPTDLDEYHLSSVVGPNSPTYVAGAAECGARTTEGRCFRPHSAAVCTQRASNACDEEGSHPAGPRWCPTDAGLASRPSVAHSHDPCRRSNTSTPIPGFYVVRPTALAAGQGRTFRHPIGVDATRPVPSTVRQPRSWLDAGRKLTVVNRRRHDRPRFPALSLLSRWARRPPKGPVPSLFAYAVRARAAS